MFQELSKRWNAESPAFFNKIKNFCIATGGSASAILAAASVPNIVVPAIVIKIASYIVIASAAAGITAKTTVKNTEDLK
ncbi:MAG: hypothetical protein WCP46_00070 [Alphaproteobacteria bacterium]